MRFAPSIRALRFAPSIRAPMRLRSAPSIRAPLRSAPSRGPPPPSAPRRGSPPPSAPAEVRPLHPRPAEVRPLEGAALKIAVGEAEVAEVESEALPGLEGLAVVRAPEDHVERGGDVDAEGGALPLLPRLVRFRVLAQIGAERFHHRDVVPLGILGDAFERVDGAEPDLEIGDGFLGGLEGAVDLVLGGLADGGIGVAARALIALHRHPLVAVDEVVGDRADAVFAGLLGAQHLDRLGQTVGDVPLLGGLGLALVDPGLDELEGNGGEDRDARHQRAEGVGVAADVIIQRRQPLLFREGRAPRGRSAGSSRSAGTRARHSR